MCLLICINCLSSGSLHEYSVDRENAQAYDAGVKTNKWEGDISSLPAGLQLG